MRQYLYNIGVCLSQVISVILLGEPDESISQRTARAYVAKGKKSWWYYQMLIIDGIIFWEEQHCLNSLNGEKHTRTLWDWSKKC